MANAPVVSLDELLGKDRFRAHYKPDAYSEIMTPVFEAMAPSGELTPTYARLRESLAALPEHRGRLEAARVDAPLAELPLLVSEEEDILSLEPVWRSLAHRLREYLRELYRGSPESIPELPPEKVRASRHFIRELEGRVPAGERFDVFLPVQTSRTQTDKGRLEWTIYALSSEDDEAVFLKSMSYASVARALEGLLPGPDLEPGYVASRAPDLAAFCAHVRKLHEAAPDAPLAFVGSPERAAVYARLGVGKLPGTTFLGPEVKSTGSALVVTFLPWERLSPGIREDYLHGRASIYPFVGTYLFRGLSQFEVLRVLRGFNPRKRVLAGEIKAEGVSEAAVDDDFSNALRVRVLKIARLDSKAAEEGAHQDEFRNVFSEDKGYLGLYDKPLVRMSAIVRDADGFPVLEGPLATREQVKNVKLRCRKSLGSYSVVMDFVPKMQVNRHEVHWIRPIVGGDERRRFQLLGHFRARPVRADASYGSPEGTKAVDLVPLPLARASWVDLWELEHRGKLSLVEAKKVEALFTLESSLRRGLGIPAGATARTVLDALAGKAFSGHFPTLARFVRERLEREPRARALLERVKRAEDLYAAARPPERPTGTPERFAHEVVPHARSIFDRVDQAEYRRLYEELDTIVAGEREAVWFDGSGRRSRFKRKNNAQRANQLGELVDWLESWYRSLGYATSQVERHRFRWDGREHENLIVTIPGTVHPDEWVFLGDHFDTAFEGDVFDATGRRVSAAGADDNATAVAAVMLAGKVLKDVKPRRSIRLVHLTGEEFPGDCLGTRHLCSKLVQERASVAGVYIMDMIGFDRSEGLFQVSPGRGPRSLACALDVLASTAVWNRGGHGLELRPDLRVAGASCDSSLYNTDGQIYSDAGFPVVLFMEDYDIARTGYHDTHDTQQLITWPYACAIAQVAMDAALRTADRPG